MPKFLLSEFKFNIEFILFLHFVSIILKDIFENLFLCFLKNNRITKYITFSWIMTKLQLPSHSTQQASSHCKYTHIQLSDCDNATKKRFISLSGIARISLNFIQLYQSNNSKESFPRPQYKNCHGNSLKLNLNGIK